MLRHGGNYDKYYVEDNFGSPFVLRVSDSSQYDKKKKEYEFIKMLNSLDVIMSKAVDFGTCNNGANVYMLVTYVAGTALEDALPSLDKSTQYSLGIKAGGILKAIPRFISGIKQGGAMILPPRMKLSVTVVEHAANAAT